MSSSTERTEELADCETSPGSCPDCGTLLPPTSVCPTCGAGWDELPEEPDEDGGQQ